LFFAVLFTVAKIWKQPRCPGTDEWIKKMQYLYPMEFYSATKKNEIFSFTSKCMEVENIILVWLARLRRPIATCSLSYVQQRPNTNAVMLLNTGHTKGR
jgi:hypothetical protein